MDGGLVRQRATKMEGGEARERENLADVLISVGCCFTIARSIETTEHRCDSLTPAFSAYITHTAHTHIPLGYIRGRLEATANRNKKKNFFDWTVSEWIAERTISSQCLYRSFCLFGSVVPMSSSCEHDTGRIRTAQETVALNEKVLVSHGVRAAVRFRCQWLSPVPCVRHSLYSAFQHLFESRKSEKNMF